MADSPGGKEIGKVSVRVLPDTSQFATKLEEKLKEIEKFLKVKIPTDLDLSGVESGLAKLKGELKAADEKVKIKTELDSNGVKQAIESTAVQATAASARKPARVKVKPASDDFMVLMRKLAKQASGVAIENIKASPDREHLLRDLKKLNKLLAKQTAIKIPVDIGEAANVHKDAEDTVGRIKALAEKVKPAVVTVTVRADSDAFIKDLKDKAEKAAHDAHINLPTDVDGVKARRQLAKLVKELQQTVSLPIPTDVTEESNFRQHVAALAKRIIDIGSRVKPEIPVTTRLAMDADETLAKFEKLGKSIIDKTDIKLRTSPDGDSARRAFDALGKQLSRVVRTEIPVDAVPDPKILQHAESIVDRIQAVADRINPPKVRVKSELAIDNNALIKELAASGQRLSRATLLKIHGTPDEPQIRADLERLTLELGRTVRVKLPMEPQGVADLETKVRGIVGEIERVAASQNVKPIKIPTAADTDSLLRDLMKKARALGQKAEIELPVTADGRQARAEITRLMRLLEHETGITLPVNLDDRVNLRTRASSLVDDMERIFKTHHPHLDVEPRVDEHRLRLALRGVLNSFTGIGRRVKGIFGKLGDVAKLEQIGTQLGLILGRVTAYTSLLGPLILLALAGAQALVPAFATVLPLVAAIGAGVAVIALGWDALFGAKGKAGRVGGVFGGIAEQVGTLKVAIGSLLRQGMDPLVQRLSTKTFPVFAEGLKLVASATNLAMKNFVGFLSSAKATSGFKQLLTGSALAVGNLGIAFTGFSSGLLTLSVAALPAMQMVVAGINAAALKFNGFMERAARSGALQKTITDATHELGAFLSGVGGFVVRLISLLDALKPIAEGAFGALGAILDGAIVRLDRFFRNFSANPAVIAAVRSTFDGIGAAVRSLFSALDPLLNSTALRSFIGSLVQATAALVRVFGEVVSAASQVVGAFVALVGVPIISFLQRVLDPITQFADKIAGSQVAVDALASLLIIRLIPALLATRAGLAITSLFGVLTAAISGLAAALPAVIAGIQAFGVEVALAGVLEAFAAGIGAVTAALGGLLAAIIPLSLPLLALGAAIFLVLRGMHNLDADAEDAPHTFRKLADSINGLDTSKVNEKMAEAHQAAVASLEVARKGLETSNTLQQGWDAITNGPITQALKESQDALDGYNKLKDKAKVANDNLQQIAETTKVSVDALRELALSKGIDLSKAFTDPDTQRQILELGAAVDVLGTQTGLTLDQIKANVGGTAEAWTAYAKAVEDAQKKTAEAFAKDTNIFDVFKAPDAKGVGDSLSKQFADMEKRAIKFGTNIQKAIRMGLDPTIILQALEAGPAKAGPILEQIVGANGKALVAQMNKGIAVLKQQSQQAIEIARLTAIAVNSKTKQVANDFQNALTISLNSKPGDTVQEIAKRLKIPVDVVRRIGAQVGGEYGLGLVEGAQKAIDSNPLKPTVNPKVNEQPWSDYKSGIEKNPAKPDIVPNIAPFPWMNYKDTALTPVHPDIIPRINKEPWSTYEQVVAHTVITPGITPVVNRGAWDRFRTEVVNFHPSVAIGATAPKVKEAATGGLITGPGTYTSDSIPARLSHMEYVQPAHTVLHYGVDVMEALRAHRIPKHVLLALANGRATPIAAAAPATRMPMAATRIVAASVLADDRTPAPAAPSHPRTLTIVDHDGVFRGQMRVAAIKSHRQKAQAERLRRLGTWVS